MTLAPIALSTFGLVLLILAALVALGLIGGFLAVKARDRRQAGVYNEHVAAADQALEEARASDRGWNRATMDAAAQGALSQARPAFAYEDLHLVLVDDRPGTDEDRARYVAIGDDGEVHVVLTRNGDSWSAESVE